MKKVYRVADAHDANFKLQFLLGSDELPEILREGEYTAPELLEALKGLSESHAPHKIAIINRLIEAGAIEGDKFSISEARKELWKDPEYRAKVISRLSEAHKELWKDPEHRARMSEAHKELWKDPEHRAKVISRLSEACKVRSSILLFYKSLPQDTRDSYSLDRLYSAWLARAGIELWKGKLGEQLETYKREGKGRLGFIQDMVSYRDTDHWRGYFERFSRAVTSLRKKSYLPTQTEGALAKT